jgi:hypothetical protein
VSLDSPGNVRVRVGGAFALLQTDETIALIGDEVRATFFGFVKDGVSIDAAKYPSVKDWDVEGVAMTIGIGKAE